MSVDSSAASTVRSEPLKNSLMEHRRSKLREMCYRRDTRKCSCSMMSKPTNTIRSPRFWDARGGILSPSCTRRDSAFVRFCGRRIGVTGERNANQCADRLFQNVEAINSSVPKPDYVGSNGAMVLRKEDTAGKKELLHRTRTKLRMNS